MRFDYWHWRNSIRGRPIASIEKFDNLELALAKLKGRDSVGAPSAL